LDNQILVYSTDNFRQNRKKRFAGHSVAGHACQAGFSPDGKWIYINSDRSGKEAVWRFPAEGAGHDDKKAEMVVNDGLEDWFPHISPDGKKMVYIGYPAGTPTHNPRNVSIAVKLVAINHGKVDASQKPLVEATGGQGSMNVNSWAPDSMRFAYVTYEALPKKP